MKLIKKDKELRNIALTVKLTASERARLAELARHYETSNADLVVWMVEQELGRLSLESSCQSPIQPRKAMITANMPSKSLSTETLEELTMQVSRLAREIELLRTGSRVEPPCQ